MVRWFSRGVVLAVLLWFAWWFAAIISGRTDFFVGDRYTFEVLSAGVGFLLVARAWAVRRWRLPGSSRGGEFGRLAGPPTTR